MDTQTENATVDARGQHCPMPIVLANKAIKGLAVGEVLKVLATDRGSIADIPAWADGTGHEVLSSGEEEGVLVFYIRRGEEEL